MKIIHYLFLPGLFWCMRLQAQNVGIGTQSPQKLLTVRGSILIDAGNENAGSLDSAALRFGTNTGVGILSARSGVVNVNGLSFQTANTDRIVITSIGRVGINDATPSYMLDVNGSLRTVGAIYANSAVTIDGILYANTNAYVYNNLYVADYVGIGATPSSSYKMNVNGNLLVQTNIGVDGNARVDGNAVVGGKITNDGKGIMLSNTSTTLRSGFTTGTFSLALGAGAVADVTFYITPFNGTNSNVRVMVAQFAPGSGASNWGGVVFTPHSVNDSDPNFGNNSTVKIRMQNASSGAANLGTDAVLYLYTVVTN